MGKNFVKAATLVAPHKLEIREYPYPEVKDGGMLIKMNLAGICGTDKHSYEGYLNQYSGSEAPKLLPLPIIPGHENVGVVAEVDPHHVFLDYYDQPVGVGDRVVVAANISCGHCYYCRMGFPYCCCVNTVDYGNNLGAANPPHLFGGWGEYMYVLPGSYVFKVPDDLPDEVAVLTELIALTSSLDKAKQFSVVSNEGFRFGDTVLIQGAGPVGICHILKARMLGAGRIIAIDRFDYRLDIARQMGADECINLSNTSRPERLELVRDLTHGRGADVIVECAGVPEAVTEGFDLLRLAGLYIEVGNFVDVGSSQFNPHRDLCSKNIRLFGVNGEELTAYGPALEQLSRYQTTMPLNKVVTHKFPVAKATEAMETALSGQAIKVVIHP